MANNTGPETVMIRMTHQNKVVEVPMRLSKASEFVANFFDMYSIEDYTRVGMTKEQMDEFSDFDDYLRETSEETIDMPLATLTIHVHGQEPLTFTTSIDEIQGAMRELDCDVLESTLMKTSKISESDAEKTIENLFELKHHIDTIVDEN